MTDEEIKHILEKYKKRLEYDRSRYHEVLKNDPEFIEKNRARAREHYALNKEVKKTLYEENKPIMRARSSYRYYKKQSRESEFIEKYPDKYKILVDANDSCLTPSQSHPH